MTPKRPGGNIILDFKNSEPGLKRFFQIREGEIYCLRIHFKVKFDIVYGLKLVNNVYKMFAKVEKEE